VQRSKEAVVHLMARRVLDRTGLLARLEAPSAPVPGDAPGEPQASPRLRTGGRHPRDIRLLPGSRDFH